MSVKRRPKTDPVQKQRILFRAADVGDEQASAEFNVPQSTIRQWRWKEKQGPAGLRMPDAETVRSTAPSRRAVNARAKADLVGDELSPDELRRSAKQARRAMDAAIKRLHQVLETAKNPRDIAIAAGICFDKASDMAALTMALEEHNVRVSAAQGEKIAAVLELALGALGVPVTAAVKAVFRELLGQAVGDGPMSVSPALAEPARAEVWERVEEMVRRELLERPALPAPADPLEEDVETEPVEADEAEAVDVLPAEEEIADAEIVEPDPVPQMWLDAYHGNEALARVAWQQSERVDRERERQAAERGPDFQLGGGRGAEMREVFRSPTGGLT